MGKLERFLRFNFALLFSLSLQTCKPHKSSVCGSNAKTYRNHCELHRDACLTGLKIQVAHDGHCQGTVTSTRDKTVSYKSSSATQIWPVVMKMQMLKCPLFFKTLEGF